jgi:hypothetical protein
MSRFVLVGECWGCRELFAYDPEKVPCARIGGEDRPICEPCVVRIAPIRKAKGLPEIVVKPGAYVDLTAEQMEGR